MAVDLDIIKKGCYAIDQYLFAYTKMEQLNVELAKQQQDIEDTVDLMSGDQQAVVSCGLSNNAINLLEKEAINGGAYQSQMDVNQALIIDYFNNIRSNQNQQSQIGYILYPNYGKKITVTSNNIVVQNL